MPYTDLNLGKVHSGYMPHCWFGRPLVLSDVKAATMEAIESELNLGCDGFVFRLTLQPNTPAFKEQGLFFEKILQSYSQVAFVYIELKEDGIEAETLEIIHRHAFPKGYMIASKNPRILIELWRIDPKPNLNIALIVEAEKDFLGLEHCPYTTVEIAENIATHNRILKIHKSAKAVFIRASINKKADESQIKRTEKRLQWLIHEGVDAIITDQTQLLTRMMSLSVK